MPGPGEGPFYFPPDPRMAAMAQRGGPPPGGGGGMSGGMGGGGGLGAMLGGKGGAQGGGQGPTPGIPGPNRAIGMGGGQGQGGGGSGAHQLLQQAHLMSQADPKVVLERAKADTEKARMQHTALKHQTGMQMAAAKAKHAAAAKHPLGGMAVQPTMGWKMGPDGRWSWAAGGNPYQFAQARPQYSTGGWNSGRSAAGGGFGGGGGAAGSGGGGGGRALSYGSGVGDDITRRGSGGGGNGPGDSATPDSTGRWGYSAGGQLVPLGSPADVSQGSAGGYGWGGGGPGGAWGYSAGGQPVPWNSTGDVGGYEAYSAAYGGDPNTDRFSSTFGAGDYPSLHVTPTNPNNWGSSPSSWGYGVMPGSTPESITAGEVYSGQASGWSGPGYAGDGSGGY